MIKAAALLLSTINTNADGLKPTDRRQGENRASD
jgi:hypothetical protein